MALAQDGAASAPEALDGGVTAARSDSDTIMPIEDEEAAIISAAHPS